MIIFVLFFIFTLNFISNNKYNFLHILSIKLLYFFRNIYKTSTKNVVNKQFFRRKLYFV